MSSKTTSTDISAQIAALRQAVMRAAADLAALEQRVVAPTAPARTARGTQDVTAEAVAARAPVPTPTPSLAERVETALRGGLLTLDQVCQAVRAPAGPVGAELKKLRVRHRLYNVGTVDAPRSFLRPDVASAPYAELAAAIALLVTDRPMELREVVAALTDAAPESADWTHARNRASGVLKNLQRDGYKLHVLGTSIRRRWFFSVPKSRR